MLLRHLLPLLLAFITSLLVAADNPPVEADHGTARVFPLLPPYQGVDFGANFNKLKSSGDAAYFVVRDSIVFMAVNAFWAVVHWVIWDGKVSTSQDILSSLLSPGIPVELSNPDQTSRLSFTSLSELSPTKLWNFFTDPNPSTRNLYLNIGFGLASHILWILPTFLGIIPDTSRQQERLGTAIPGIPANLAGADPVALWNRLLSPQGVLQMMAINTLNYMGKLLFWTFMSIVPDAPAAGSGRSLHIEDPGLLTEVASGLVENMEEVAWQLQLNRDFSSVLF